jgi:malate dehydrogenase (oxaloacetate-decarboxylating)
MVQSMNKDSMIFAMANPTPEIMPELAREAGAKIVATGRSDYPNQLNNVLVFPGIFAGAFQNKVSKITDDMKIQAALNLAAHVQNPTAEKIIPSPFDEGVVDAIKDAIR